MSRATYRSLQVRPFGPVVPTDPPRQGDTSNLYELQVSSPLPTVDLSHTLAQYLSAPWQATLAAFMVAHYKRLALLHRVASLMYFLVLVLPPSGWRDAVTVLVVCSLSALAATTVFLSLDVIKLIVRSHDFVFISAISLLNWTCLALMLGDLRVALCIPSWLATQVGVVIDANIRTFPTVQRSILVSIPAVLSVALCCALDKIHDPRRRVLTVGSRTLSLANVIIFASTTLIVFLLKKVVLRLKRSNSSPVGLHVIPCVLLRAKLELRRVERPTSQPSTPARLETVSSSHLRTFRLSSPIGTTTYLVCVKATPLSWWLLVPLYVTGMSGFACLVARSLLGVATGNKSDATPEAYEVFLHVGSLLSRVALACTILFCGTFAAHFQRDLLRSLLRNFDYIFSSFQAIAMSVCLGDLFPDNPADRSSFIAWAVWYQWMLTLDALAPPTKARFRFHKRLAAPVVVAFLLGGLWILVQLFVDNDLGMRNRVLLEYRVSPAQRYRLTTLGVLIERLVTILGWLSSKLVLQLVCSREHELLFVRGLVEYTSPYDTFPPTATLK